MQPPWCAPFGWTKFVCAMKSDIVEIYTVYAVCVMCIVVTRVDERDED